MMLFISIPPVCCCHGGYHIRASYIMLIGIFSKNFRGGGEIFFSCAVVFLARVLHAGGVSWRVVADTGVSVVCGCLFS